MTPHCLELNSGFRFPLFGLGTWLSQPGEVADAVKKAIFAGYRHIDCAHAYGNQKEIGACLEALFAEGAAKREELFITSKIWNTFHSYEAAKSAVDTILEELRLEYLDLCLIHWPIAYKEGGEKFPKDEDGKILYSGIDFMETWKAMEEKVAEGKIRSIGLSNFGEHQIERVWSEGNVKPAVLQVEMNAYLQQPKLIDFCAEKNLHITAYSPLGNAASPMRKEAQPLLLEDPLLREIAEAHQKTVAQIALRFLVQRGVAPIPKSTSEKRLAENFDIFDFALSEEEMLNIASLDRGLRICNAKYRDDGHPEYPWPDFHI
ncbi:hypothetical protein QR680_016930 [Steinernema hermaphroditum]|uniref:NADP-dependent oxidoreductase domain-containing protein n=1 Tax=Steinernema hermaphroditum TaxID=289476 RepID=A0AA39LN87_9BILA|nr:hypothetical protein QR680_016930 [Steinernema hermaphroditum]